MRFPFKIIRTVETTTATVSVHCYTCKHHLLERVPVVPDGSEAWVNLYCKCGTFLRLSFRLRENHAS